MEDAPLLPYLQDKLEVNGPGAHPLYKFLKQQQAASRPGQAYPAPGEGLQDPGLSL
jgi:hypothetical protein